MQRGGRIWASVTIYKSIIIICPVMHWNAIIVAPHVNYALDPVYNQHHVISHLLFVAAVQNG